MFPLLINYLSTLLITICVSVFLMFSKNEPKEFPEKFSKNIY